MHGHIGKIISFTIMRLSRGPVTAGLAFMAVFALMLLGAAECPAETTVEAAENQTAGMFVSEILLATDADDRNDSDMSEQEPRPDINAIMCAGAVHALHPALKNNFQRWNPLRKTTTQPTAGLTVSTGIGTVRRLAAPRPADDDFFFIFLSLLKDAVPVRAGPAAA